MNINNFTNAYKVSNIINQQFPHISTSKNHFALTNILEKNIDTVHLSSKGHKIVKLNLDELINWHQVLTNKLRKIREKNNNTAQKWTILKNILNQLEQDKLGNCYEEAVVAAGICELNGIKAYVAQFMKGNKFVDHAVCMFNKSGKPIENKIENNDTIIIDPWLDIVDYAKNYFAKNEAMIGTMTNIPQDGKYRIYTLFNLNIPKEGIEYFKTKYPKIFFNKNYK